MNIEDLLYYRHPGTPRLGLRVGPTPDDEIAIDLNQFEVRKSEFIAFCMEIPLVEGASWKSLRTYTNNNGAMAKLLIALGQLAGIWKMHPDPQVPELWYGNPMHPMIAIGSVVRVEIPVPTTSIPKPSAGDLEKGEQVCDCCLRLMGPPDSDLHELTLDAQDPGERCVECAEACEFGGACLVLDPPKPKAKPTPPPATLHPWEEYLRQMGGIIPTKEPK